MSKTKKEKHPSILEVVQETTKGLYFEESFEMWLKKQNHINGAVGDLARDFIDSKFESINESFIKYPPCTEAKKAYNLAIKQYKNK